MPGRLTLGIVTALLAVAGCAAESPVSPLPIEAAATSAVPPPPAATVPASASPTASPSPTRQPTTPAPTVETTTSPPKPSDTPTSPPSSSCQGAIVYLIDAANDELALIRALCLAVGAVLRIENIGPGEVTTDSPELVDPNYAAGVYEIRLVRPGTVVVTIMKNGEPYPVTVVIR